MTEKTVSKIEEKTIQVDDKVYSAKVLAADHPGGDLFIKAFAGRDATEAFMSYHRRRFPHQKMEYAAVGKAIAIKSPDADKDYLELCEIVDKVLPRNKSFAPFSYYLKVFFILSVAIGLEVIFRVIVVVLLMSPGIYSCTQGIRVVLDDNCRSILRLHWPQYPA